MIPEGWEVIKIGDVGRVVTGSTPPTSRADYYGGETPFVAPGDLGRSKFVDQAEKTLTRLGLGVSRAIPAGSTLFTCIGSTIGKLGLAAVPVTTNQQINAVIPSTAYDNGFIYYQLEANAPAIAQIAGTQAVPMLSKSQFSAQRILVAPLPEQRRIADILSTWDRAIETVEALIANARDQKTALMQALLTGRTRLRGFAAAWTPTTIGAVCDQVTERAGAATDLPILSCSKHDGFVESLKYFKKKVFGDDLTGYKVVRRGMIGFPTNHVEEGSIARQDIVEAGLVSPIYCVFQPRDVDGEFLIRLLKTDEFTQRFAAATNASVNRRGSLRWNEFAKLRFNLPPRDEQRAIAAVINDAEAKERALAAQRDALREEKAALMQQLLTGKRRVKADKGEDE